MDNKKRVVIRIKVGDKHDIKRKEFYGKYGTSVGIKGKGIKESIGGTKKTGDDTVVVKIVVLQKKLIEKMVVEKVKIKKKTHLHNSCIYLK